MIAACSHPRIVVPIQCPSVLLLVKGTDHLIFAVSYICNGWRRLILPSLVLFLFLSLSLLFLDRTIKGVFTIFLIEWGGLFCQDAVFKRPRDGEVRDSRATKRSTMLTGQELAGETDTAGDTGGGGGEVRGSTLLDSSCRGNCVVQ